jgi:hypothetical protein
VETLILEIGTRGLHRYQQIDREVTTIGRALDNDIILSDPTVAPHHLKIIRYGDNSIELVNLTGVNPTRIHNQRLQSLVTEKLPLRLTLGRVQAQLLSSDHAVAETRSLAVHGHGNRLFGNVYWTLFLVLACLCLGGLEYYLNSYNIVKLSDLLKYVLRETVLTIGAFVLALSILERLLVNRWEIRQLITSICLLYLLFKFISMISGELNYLFSASWPSIWLYFGWLLTIIPCAIALYLIHISHMTYKRSVLLAILISSPIAVPSLLQNQHLRIMLDDFSSTAIYQNSLSPLNWHLKDSVSVDGFIEQAKALGPGEFAD